MSRKGNCLDNAVAESFFKTIKVEAVYNEIYHDHNHAKLSLFKWIETWYNRKRRHSALGYKTMEEFEILNNNQNLLHSLTWRPTFCCISKFILIRI